MISWRYDEDNGDLTGGCRDENDVAHANVPAVHSIESPNIGMVYDSLQFGGVHK